MTEARRLYQNPRVGASFTGLQTFLRNRNFKDSKAAANEVKKLKSYYLHKQVRKRFKRRKVITLFKDFLWGTDIIDLRKFARENRAFSWLLVVVDAFSKKLYTAPLKDKSMISVHRALSKIYKQSFPRLLQADEG